MKLSANLGFLWNELAIADAIQAAALAGFDGVECHWPYENSAPDVKQALNQAKLPMLSLNTLPGDLEKGEFGLAALPGRENQAREDIDQAISYAAATGTYHIHVMAGKSAKTPHARDTFLANLEYAASVARSQGIGILIEPINQRDIPGYFLSHVETAVEIIQELGLPEIKMLFDCYHVQIMQGDLMHRLEKNLDHIGHIQIAAVPSRAEPDEGEIAYDRLLGQLGRLEYQGFVGAEYRPRVSTDQGLAWMKALNTM